MPHPSYHDVPRPPAQDAPVSGERLIRIMATRGDSELQDDVALGDLPGLLADPNAQVWVDCWGSDNPEAVRLARDVFHFHPMAIEDCFGARAHPKVEGFEGHVYVITHGVAADSTAEEIHTVELDSFLGERFLFTYHEASTRSVAGVAEMVLRNHGLPLRHGPSTVLHAILDRQVDGMETVLDDLEERIQALEDQVMVRPRREDLTALLDLKRSTLHLRRWLTKQREVMLRLSRNEFSLVPTQEAVLFRDVYDHLYRYTDLVENHREMITSLQETYLSVINLRLGEVMKFLTVFSSVLMPLTLIAGIFGMNFEFMPELHKRWGYPAALGSMALVAGGLILFFYRRGWIGHGDDLPPGAR